MFNRDIKKRTNSIDLERQMRPAERPRGLGKQKNIRERLKAEIEKKHFLDVTDVLTPVNVAKGFAKVITRYEHGGLQGTLKDMCDLDANVFYTNPKLEKIRDVHAVNATLRDKSEIEKLTFYNKPIAFNCDQYIKSGVTTVSAPLLLYSADNLNTADRKCLNWALGIICDRTNYETNNIVADKVFFDQFAVLIYIVLAYIQCKLPISEATDRQMLLILALLTSFMTAIEIQSPVAAIGQISVLYYVKSKKLDAKPQAAPPLNEEKSTTESKRPAQEFTHKRKTEARETNTLDTIADVEKMKKQATATKLHEEFVQLSSAITKLLSSSLILPAWANGTLERSELEQKLKNNFQHRLDEFFLPKSTVTISALETFIAELQSSLVFLKQQKIKIEAANTAAREEEILERRRANIAARSTTFVSTKVKFRDEEGASSSTHLIPAVVSSERKVAAKKITDTASFFKTLDGNRPAVPLHHTLSLSPQTEEKKTILPHIAKTISLDVFNSPALSQVRDYLQQLELIHSQYAASIKTHTQATKIALKSSILYLMKRVSVALKVLPQFMDGSDKASPFVQFVVDCRTGTKKHGYFMLSAEDAISSIPHFLRHLQSTIGLPVTLPATESAQTIALYKQLQHHHLQIKDNNMAEKEVVWIIKKLLSDLRKITDEVKDETLLIPALRGIIAECGSFRSGLANIEGKHSKKMFKNPLEVLGAFLVRCQEFDNKEGHELAGEDLGMLFSLCEQVKSIDFNLLATQIPDKAAKALKEGKILSLLTHYMDLYDSTVPAEDAVVSAKKAKR